MRQRIGTFALPNPSYKEQSHITTTPSAHHQIKPKPQIHRNGQIQEPYRMISGEERADSRTTIRRARRIKMGSRSRSLIELLRSRGLILRYDIPFPAVASYLLLCHGLLICFVQFASGLCAKYVAVTRCAF